MDEMSAVINQLHHKAMAFADEAIVAKHKGGLETAQFKYLEVFTHPHLPDPPTQKILVQQHCRQTQVCSINCRQYPPPFLLVMYPCPGKQQKKIRYRPQVVGQIGRQESSKEKEHHKQVSSQKKKGPGHFGGFFPEVKEKNGKERGCDYVAVHGH